jgi:phage baseplate assembly protein gpV
VSVARGNFLGDGALFIEDHAAAGSVRLASTLKGDDLPVSGDGSLALLTFRALEAGTSQLDVDELQLFGGSLGEDELAGKARSIPVRVTAPPARTTLVLQIGSSAMKVGKASVALDAPPLIIEGRTLVPIRAVVESLGGTVSWDAAARTATVSLGGVSLKLTVGQATALVNDLQVPVDSGNPDVVPRIISGRTMLPLRFVAENLGAGVQWEGSTQTITITYPKP